MPNSSVTLVPNYLEAPSKEGLLVKMVNNNLKHHAQFQYFDIQKDGKKWVAWYYFEMGDIIKSKIGVTNEL